MSQDKVWLLSCSEIWNNGGNNQPYGHAVSKEGEQYKYYENVNANANTTNSNLIKKNSGSAWTWWLRSPGYNFGSRFCYTDQYGKCGSATAASNSNNSVAPGFAI